MVDESRKLRLADFSAWAARHIRGDEKGEAQIFLDRLFQAFAQRGCLDVGGQPEFRVRKAADDGGGAAFADYVWRPVVLIEMKKRGADLARHYRQAFDYWTRIVPGRPQYVVLCNFDEFWVYDFNIQMDTPVDRVGLAELPDRPGPLAFLFPTREKPVFGNDHEAVTRKAADHLAQCFNMLIARRVERPLAQRFVLQMLVALFAEDIGLLEQYFVARLLEECKAPADSFDLLGGLFEAMNTPGKIPGGRFKGVDYFNGGLFAQPARLELQFNEIAQLRSAARADWSKVRPEIFGTLFEHSLGQEERHAYGAHFTSPVDIMKIVGPTLVEPWRERIENASRLADLRELLRRMQTVTVLDPACGSGNFLYLAYRELKRLEARLFERLDEFPSERAAGPRLGFVTARQFFGMDINPFAVELAKVTMMIARKFAIDELHVHEQPLPLDNLDANFIAGDALIDPAGQPAAWPRADLIIGNPPFLGAKRLKPERGADYVNAIRKLYPDVPGMADYCVYWLRRAHDHLPVCTPADPLTGRAGLVGTQNIRNNQSRVGGLDHIVKTGTIVEAVDNQPWSGEANVHVSIVNWVKTSDVAQPPSAVIADVARPPSAVTSAEGRISGLRPESQPRAAVPQQQQESQPGAAVPQTQESPPGPAGFAKPSPAHYRRNLPHIQAEGRPIEITFPTWGRWTLPESARGKVLAHCLHDHRTKCYVHVVVVMPDHVHMIITLMRDARGYAFGLPEIMNGIKGASAHTVNRLLGRRGHVWQDESFDHVIRSDESLEEKLEYICKNPVRKGLVKDENEYPWLWRAWIEGKNVAQPPSAVIANVAQPPSAVTANVAQPPSAVIADVARPPSAVIANVAQPPSAVIADVARPPSAVTSAEGRISGLRPESQPRAAVPQQQQQQESQPGAAVPHSMAFDPAKLMIPASKKLWSKVNPPAGAKIARKRGTGPASKEFELAFRECPHINSALSDQVDVGAAAELPCNQEPPRVFNGQFPRHQGFVITPKEAAKFFTIDPANREVVHPFLIGAEMLTKPEPQRWIIDFQKLDMISAARYAVPFTWIERRILPHITEYAKRELAETGRDTGQDQTWLRKWWQHFRCRKEMVDIVAKLPRYLACAEVTKRPIFCFIDSDVRPDHTLEIFTLPDDYSFGVLQSAAHWLWFITKCSKLTERFRYTPESVFDTFPWPQRPTGRQVEAVASAGRAVRRVRAAAVEKISGGLRAVYRTLELPGANPLKDAHAALDAAVLAAYGFSPADDILGRLLALNLEVAGRIEARQPVTAPGVPADYPDPARLVSDDCIRPAGGA